jgi:hypothetical protein
LSLVVLSLFRWLIAADAIRMDVVSVAIEELWQVSEKTTSR